MFDILISVEPEVFARLTPAGAQCIRNQVLFWVEQPHIRGYHRVTPPSPAAVELVKLAIESPTTTLLDVRAYPTIWVQKPLRSNKTKKATK